MTKDFDKVLIIENEYDLDASIKGFLKDCPIFREINEQTFCLNRKVDDLFRFVMEVDTIMIATTFMYKDQVLEYCNKFLSLPNGAFTKFNFFVFRCCRTFNEWRNAESWEREEKELRQAIIQLIERGHKIYDYFEDWDSPRNIDDECCEYGIKRSKYTYRQLLYSKKDDMFYLENDKYCSLENMKDEYNN